MTAGFRTIKATTSIDLDSGTSDFGLVDQKGRKMGYRWGIRQYTVELMTPDDVLAARAQGQVFFPLYDDSLPLIYIELVTTPTRDGLSYGPAFNRRRANTLEEARRICVKRAEAARKRDTKKFAAFNPTGASA